MLQPKTNLFFYRLNICLDTTPSAAESVKIEDIISAKNKFNQDAKKLFILDFPDPELKKIKIKIKPIIDTTLTELEKAKSNEELAKISKDKLKELTAEVEKQKNVIESKIEIENKISKVEKRTRMEIEDFYAKEVAAGHWDKETLGNKPKKIIGIFLYYWRNVNEEALDKLSDESLLTLNGNLPNDVIVSVKDFKKYIYNTIAELNRGDAEIDDKIINPDWFTNQPTYDVAKDDKGKIILPKVKNEKGEFTDIAFSSTLSNEDIDSYKVYFLQKLEERDKLVKKFKDAHGSVGDLQEYQKQITSANNKCPNRWRNYPVEWIIGSWKEHQKKPQYLAIVLAEIDILTKAIRKLKSQES